MAVLGYDVDIPRYSNQKNSGFFLSKAAKLMNITEHTFDSTAQVVETNLCKAYLH